jgi:hypothetical protein
MKMVRTMTPKIPAEIKRNIFTVKKALNCWLHILEMRTSSNLLTRKCSVIFW